MAKILIVDDELTTRMELQEVLSSLGYDVVGEAETGEEALQMARELKPDLIIMDIVMPGEMDGISAAEKIKAESDIAIVFVTGFGDPEHIERAKQVEPFGYVMKPFDEKEIRGFVEIALYKRNIEKELRESHAKLMALFENTEEFIMIADEKGAPQSFNDAYKRIMKEALDLDMKPGIQPHKLLKDPQAVQFWDELHRRVLNGEKFKSEFTQELLNGDTRHFEFSFCPIIESGEVKGFVEVSRDITDRQRAQEELQKTRKEWEQIFQAVGQPAFILDDHHGVIHANRATEKSTGKPRESLIGKKCYKIFHHSDGPPEGCPFEKMCETGRPETKEIEVEMLNGTFLISCTPIYDKNGHLDKVIHYATDITEQRNIHKILEQSELRLKFALRTANAGIWEWNFETDDVYIDDVTLRQLGYAPEAFTGEMRKGRWWVDQIHPEDVQSRADRFNRFQAGKSERYEAQFRMKRKDGGYVWIGSYADAISRDKNGMPLVVVGIHRDINERKLAETGLLESEKKFRALFDDSPQPLTLNELKTGTFVDMNDKFCELTGCSKEELTGNTPLGMRFIGKQASLEVTQQLKDKGMLNGFGLDFINSDGDRVNMELYARVLSISGIPHVLAMFIDVTERRVLEAQLRRVRES